MQIAPLVSFYGYSYSCSILVDWEELRARQEPMTETDGRGRTDERAHPNYTKAITSHTTIARDFRSPAGRSQACGIDGAVRTSQRPKRRSRS